MGTSFTGRRALRGARNLGLAGLVAGGLTVAAAVPSSAGVNFSVEGEVACDETTGEYVVTWTLDNAGFESTIEEALQTPGGDITDTVTPNPIPADTIATATGRAPGTTNGAIALVVTDSQPLTGVGSVLVDGTCTAPTPPPTPVEPEVIRFTG